MTYNGLHDLGGRDAGTSTRGQMLSVTSSVLTISRMFYLLPACCDNCVDAADRSPGARQGVVLELYGFCGRPDV